ncbi:MAG: outer membrane beta-barrel protein [Bacteroidetes bacterium]|nr:outer membrane beta-barrel protein [Bacteroidota bacterium]
MIRPVFISIAALTIILSLSFQLSAQRFTFEGGFTAGLNRADFLGEKEKFWFDDYNRSATSGISAGPFVKCNFNIDTYGLLELRYTRKGCKFGYINKIFTQSFERVILDYIELPVMYGANSVFHGKSGDKAFAFETGFAFSRLFSSRLDYDPEMKREVTANISGFRNYDISWIGRIKIPYKTKKRHALLWGFRIEDSLLSINNQYKLRNFCFGIELNYVAKNL